MRKRHQIFTDHSQLRLELFFFDDINYQARDALCFMDQE